VRVWCVESYDFEDRCRWEDDVTICDVELVLATSTDKIRLSSAVMVHLKSVLPAHKKFESNVALW
jgi:hypothetical protein